MIRKIFWLAIFSVQLANFSLLQAKGTFTLEDIFEKHVFAWKSIDEFTHMPDGVHYAFLSGGNAIVQKQYINKNISDTLLTLNELSAEIQSIYAFSSDSSGYKFLLATEPEFIYRHTYNAIYWVYDTKTGLPTNVSPNQLQMAKLSPNGQHVAYTLKNNLYVLNLSSGKTKQVTTNGKLNKIINGMPDWVYEEEFALTTGFFWSPDSKNIAFYRFDEERVREFSFTRYDSLYPTEYRFKYPKAGEENAVVSIHVYSLENDLVSPIDLKQPADAYIPRIKWSPDSRKLLVSHLNRLQNKHQLFEYRLKTKALKRIYHEVEDAYISEVGDDFAQYINANQLILKSERKGYTHLYLIDTENGTVQDITTGKWDVQEFLGFDIKSGKVFYTSTELSPLEKHLYAININLGKKEKLTPETGVHEIVFSSDFRYFIDTYSSANQPFVHVVKNMQGKPLQYLEKNEALQAKIKEEKFQHKEFFTFENRHGDTLNGFMIKPAKIKKNKKLPALMYVYGGPESQKVLEEWSYFNPWLQYLVNQGYIVVCVDNRGTDGRGEQFRKATYLNLGIPDSDDQIDAAKYISTLPFIDSERIGMFGWSYGGYMTLMCMARGSGLIKTGIAIAPVTHWKFYDTIYTERFMRTPNENRHGYEKGSPINYAKQITGNLLMVHGTADDNVHFQNSLEMSKELVKNNIPFDFEVYTDKNHSIYGGNTRLHLFNKVSKYIEKNL